MYSSFAMEPWPSGKSIRPSRALAKYGDPCCGQASTLIAHHLHRPRDFRLRSGAGGIAPPSAPVAPSRALRGVSPRPDTTHLPIHPVRASDAFGHTGAPTPAARVPARNPGEQRERWDLPHLEPPAPWGAGPGATPASSPRRRSSFSLNAAF